jgi:hypothetical protein
MNNWKTIHSKQSRIPGHKPVAVMCENGSKRFVYLTPADYHYAEKPSRRVRQPAPRVRRSARMVG